MPEAPVIAIGDSDQDVAMLELAEQWYAPGSCSARVRELARATGGRVVPGQGQRGLLQATNDVLQRRGAVAEVVPGLGRPARVRTFADLLLAILRAADRPRAAQVLAAAAWRGLHSCGTRRRASGEQHRGRARWGGEHRLLHVTGRGAGLGAPRLGRSAGSDRRRIAVHELGVASGLGRWRIGAGL